MLSVVTLNANGIRAAHRKGFGDWLARGRADIVCVQELKAQAADLAPAIAAPAGMRGYFACAEKRGYSGVCIYSRQKPQAVCAAFGDGAIDAEGRFLRLDFAGYSVVSLYLPSGSSGEARQRFKYRMMDKVYPLLKRLRASGREFILCGDWNIAHAERDLRNWRANQKNSGFLPEERAWLSEVFNRLGWVDVFRRLNQEDGQYTWWSNRGRAWEKNVGWRIDYQIATPKIAAAARRAAIYKDERFSDHAPLTIDYRYPKR